MHRPAKPARRQVDQIVETSRGPAEILVTRRQMTDHRIGRIDRLVGREASQPENCEPESRRHDPVREILGSGFDRRPADAGLVERGRFAADDPCHRRPGFRQATGLEGAGDGGDVVVEAAAGKQDCRDQNRADPAIGDTGKTIFQTETDCCRERHDEQERNGAGNSAQDRSVARTIERPVKPVDQSADQRDRVGDLSPDEVGVSNQGVDSQGRCQHPEMVEADHRPCVTRRASDESQSSASGSDGPPQTVSLSGRRIRLLAG